MAARAGKEALEKGFLWPCFMLAAFVEGYHLSSVFKSLPYTLPLGNQSHFVIHGVWHLLALFFYQTLVGKGNLRQVGSFREHQPLELKKKFSLSPVLNLCNFSSDFSDMSPGRRINTGFALVYSAEQLLARSMVGCFSSLLLKPEIGQAAKQRF